MTLNLNLFHLMIIKPILKQKLLKIKLNSINFMEKLK